MYQINLQFRRDASETLTQQLYAFIKQEIGKGNFTRCEKLPSKRSLAHSLDCSTNTVEAAYNQLVDEGYLVAKEKSGYYIACLDGMLNLPKQTEGFAFLEKQNATYCHDFSYQGVDHDTFPFSLWKRITYQIINTQDKSLLCISDPKGLPELRNSIARYVKSSRGVDCTAEQIIISSGTEFLLQLLIQLLEQEACYALENPGYEKLGLLFKSNRVRFAAIGLDAQGMEVQALQDSQATVACITPSHQFPTGTIMPVQRRIQLLNWTYEMPGRYIVEDDYDSEFRYTGKPIPSLQGLDKQGRVIYMGAFSKSLSPALRISYMVLPPQLMGIYEERLDFYYCPVPIIEQKTLQIFIEQGHFERHLNRMRKLYGQKREILVAALQTSLPFVRIQGDLAGLHLLITVKNGMSEDQLIERAKEHQVRVYGLSRYYIHPDKMHREATLLLGFASLGVDQIPKAVALLKQAWQPTS